MGGPAQQEWYIRLVDQKLDWPVDIGPNQWHVEKVSQGPGQGEVIIRLVNLDQPGGEKKRPPIVVSVQVSVSGPTRQVSFIVGSGSDDSVEKL